MDEQNSIKQRLLAVLDYDRIPQRKRAAHLAAACGRASATARRWLSVDAAAGNMKLDSLLDLAAGLDVDVFGCGTAALKGCTREHSAFTRNRSSTTRKMLPTK